MDPGRDAVYFESGGGCQHYDAGSFPAQFKGLSVVPLDINPVSWPVPMRCQSRASLVDGVEVCPNVLMHFLELSTVASQALRVGVPRGLGDPGRAPKCYAQNS